MEKRLFILSIVMVFMSICLLFNKQEKKIEALELEQLMLYSKLEELEAKIYIEVE